SVRMIILRMTELSSTTRTLSAMLPSGSAQLVARAVALDRDLAGPDAKRHRPRLPAADVLGAQQEPIFPEKLAEHHHVARADREDALRAARRRSRAGDLDDDALFAGAQLVAGAEERRHARVDERGRVRLGAGRVDARERLHRVEQAADPRDRVVDRDADAA